MLLTDVPMEVAGQENDKGMKTTLVLSKEIKLFTIWVSISIQIKVNWV